MKFTNVALGISSVAFLGTEASSNSPTSLSSAPNLRQISVSSLRDKLEEQAQNLGYWKMLTETETPASLKQLLLSVSEIASSSEAMIADCNDKVIALQITSSLANNLLVPRTVDFCWGYKSDQEVADKLTAVIQEAYSNTYVLKDHYEALEARLLDSGMYVSFRPEPVFVDVDYDDEEED